MSETVRIGLAASSQNSNNFCDAVVKGLSVVSDSDDDQIQDLWELEYFNSLTATEGGTGNYDGDVNTDWEEFLLGTDPKSPQSFFRSSPTKAENGYLEIEFDATSGLTYTLEVSETLSPESWEAVKTINPSTDGPQTLDHLHPGTPSILFGRIKAER